MSGFNSIEETMKLYLQGIAKKASISSWGMIFRGILAGAMIAFGAEASNVASHGIADVGLARTVAGVVFPIGLMMVILLGAELFTGDCMLTIGVTKKVISLAKCCKMMFAVYVGNFVGGVFIAAMTYFSGQFNYSGGGLGAYTLKIAIGKVNMSFGSAIISGILCNILVCAAVLMAMCAKDIGGKILVSFFIIFAFVISGFEHCVANMYYITAGLFCKLNPEYVSLAMEKYGISASAIESLNIKTFLLNNLVPVTIGNIVGGALLVGIPLYYLNVSKEKKIRRTSNELYFDNRRCDAN